MGLSSNILWHQTTIDGLKGILKEKGFFYSYSLEEISGEKIKITAAFPMVSVCDFPLCEIGGYLKRYGGYSIGLSREWGIKNGLSPVWYCGATSSVLNLQLEEFKQICKPDVNNGNIERFLYLFSYIKNYEGVLPKRGYRTYRFYDEREFRIVPTTDTLEKHSIQQLLFADEYKEYKDKNGSSMIPAIKLLFDWDDIRYIIVENDKNVEEFKRIISKASKRDNLRVNYFTNNQIKEDVIGGDHNLMLHESLGIKEAFNSRAQFKSGEKVTHSIKRSRKEK